MKKTITITIAGSLFHIEDDAYDQLSKYLDSIKQHFSSNSEKEEIISDIESRIAEQFNEKHPDSNKIINLKDVEMLIKSMGNVEDFNDSESTGTETVKGRVETKRKLFRNPDDVVVAGVASGIGAYFDIDPVIIRLIFVLVVFLGGSGVLIYLILWLVIPMAKTSTDKLQMRGEAITLESVNQVFKEKIDEVKKNKSLFRKIITFPFIVIRRIFEVLFPIIRKIIALVIILGSIFALFGMVVALSTVVFNIQSPYIDFPLMQLGHPIAIIVGIVATFFTLFIPTIFLLFLGIRIWGKTKFVSNVFNLSLVGFWFISAIVLIVIGTKLIPEYKNYIETNPEYIVTTKTIDLKDFSKISIEDGANVTIAESPEFKVTATGREIDMQYLNFKVADNTLDLSRNHEFKICIFCSSKNPKITIYMPKIDSITATNGSSINAKVASSTDLTINLSNASRLELNANLNTLLLELSNGSYSKITGTSTSVTLKISNASRLQADEFISKDINMVVENASRAEVNASRTLLIKANNGSTVKYYGNPKITKELQNGSRIQNLDSAQIPETEYNWDYYSD